MPVAGGGRVGFVADAADPGLDDAEVCHPCARDLRDPQGWGRRPTPRSSRSIPAGIVRKGCSLRMRCDLQGAFSGVADPPREVGAGSVCPRAHGMPPEGPKWTIFFIF